MGTLPRTAARVALDGPGKALTTVALNTRKHWEPPSLSGALMDLFIPSWNCAQVSRRS